MAVATSGGVQWTVKDSRTNSLPTSKGVNVTIYESVCIIAMYVLKTSIEQG